MKLLLASILIALVGLTHPQAAVAEDGTFYLHTSGVVLPLAGGRTGTHVLTLDPPTNTDDPRWKGATINPGDMVMVGEFVSLRAPGVAQVNPSPATVTLHLVTTGQPITGRAMFQCADIRIDLYHDSPGHRVLISDEDFFDQTISPDHRIGQPTPPEPLTFTLRLDPARTALAPGDGFSLEVRVRNRCTEVRRVLLLYDAVSTPSRLVLVDNCPGLSNPDQLDGDGDGIGDACEGGPPQGSPDTDGDGIEEKRDACPGTPRAQLVDTTGCACSQLNCDDHEPCTADACEAGHGCQHVTDCACPSLSCDDGDVCTTDSCVPGPGCQHTAATGVGGASCHLRQLHNTVKTAPPGEVAAKLARPRSRLMRTLTRNVRLSDTLQTKHVRTGRIAPRDRTLRRLQRTFARSVALIETEGRMNLIGSALHARLTGIIDLVVVDLATVTLP